VHTFISYYSVGAMKKPTDKPPRQRASRVKPVVTHDGLRRKSVVVGTDSHNRPVTEWQVTHPVAQEVGSIAATLAAALHAGQLDKAGRPYIEHLTRVAAILRMRFPDATEAELEAAWLHDALEDTDATPETLLTAGISREAMDIIQLVTNPKGVVYLDWIAAILAAGNVGAIRVKLADNEDNQDPARVAMVRGADQMVKTRCAPARAILLKGLR
jgi:(p)ppGpp synthase/HD superfamily hydrolase